MIENIFGVPVFWDIALMKERIDNALSNVDLKSYTKNNQSEEKSQNSKWDCIVSTGHREDLILGDEEWVQEFIECIRYEIFYYIRQFKINNGAEVIPKIDLWVNYYEKNNWQDRHNHVHRDNVISFTYLYKSPYNSGNFRFHNPLPNMNSKHFVFCKLHEDMSEAEGSLFIFPSWLDHSVTINKSNQDRITISGNIFFEEVFEE